MQIRLLMVALMCALFVLTARAESTREVQRDQFRRALSALKADDMAAFYRLESSLRSYVLHPYLRFALGARRIQEGELAGAQAKAMQLEGEFHGSFLAWRTMRLLRDRLRDEERWQLLLDTASLPSAPEMPCASLRARHVLGQLQRSDAALAQLWQQRQWQPDCEWVLQRRLAAGEVAVSNLWQHVYALMDVGLLERAATFKQYFNRRDQALIQAWIDGHDKPADALADKRWHADTALNRRAFKHFISRLSRLDARAAREQWGAAFRAARYDAETLNAAARTQSLRAASDSIPEALDWLKWLPQAVQDSRSREASLRLAVRLGRWQSIVEFADKLPDEEATRSEWRYWLAVAQWELGAQEQARQGFLALSRLRSYYGFLAADRVQQPYAMHYEATASDAKLRDTLQARADVQRMREYLFVGLRAEARAEWQPLINKLSVPLRAELSLMLLDWGWYDRALASNARTGLHNDLRVRFPFAFRDSIQAAAQQHELPLEWVFALARRESLFQPDIRSAVGAIGLMQLMPATAQDVARRAGKKMSVGALENPEFNIALGTFYLRYLLNRFDQHPLLATASYNAGLSRVPKWLGGEATAADRWVEAIPYRETRDYLKAVLASSVVYDWRLDGALDQRLSDRMPVLPARK